LVRQADARRAVSVVEAGLEVGARRAERTATVHIGLVAVADEIGARCGEADAVADLALAVGVLRAVRVVGTRRAIATTVHSELTAVLDTVVAGGRGTRARIAQLTFAIRVLCTELVGGARWALRSAAVQIGLETVQFVVGAVTRAAPA
jgi:hypothetical protein